jgi:DNA-binding CsgD family transcriptional regulator
VLHGREAERSALAALLDGARAGRSGVLVLRGQAGVGKSSLLADAVGRAGDARVLATQGIESESELAFSALHQLLRPVTALLDRLPPPQARALRVAFGEEDGAAGDRFLVSLATLSLLAEAAETGPVLAVVDDAQWLDDASATALVFAARRLEAERVALVFAVREGDPHSFAAPGLPELRLSGLAGPAAQALLDERAGQLVAPAVSEQLVAGTGGNALALVELAAALTPAELRGEEPLRPALPLTEGVERAFLDQVRRLPEPAQTVLLVAAAEEAGQVGVVQRAARALGADGGGLDAVERSGLVQVRDGHLVFRHPLVRSAVYGAATTGDRQRVHTALAGALAGDAERRVWHRAAAAAGPDDEIAAELDEVARRAARRGGFDAACAALERAAELTDGAEPRAWRRWEAAANARLAGQHDRALRLLDAARWSTSDPLLRADVDLLRGAVELVAGSADTAEQILVTAARDVLSIDPGRALHLLVIGAQAASLASDSSAGVEIGRLAAQLPLGDALRDRFFGSLLVGCGHYFSGDLAAALAPLRRAVGYADELDESMLLTWAARAAFYLGDDAAAYRLDSRAVALSRAAGAVGDMLPPLQRLALSQLLLGRWPAASASAGEALRLARETGQGNLASLPLGWLAVLAAYRGQDAELRSLSTQIEAALAAHPMAVADDVRQWARGIAEAAAEHRAAALHRLERVTSPAVALMASLDRVETAAHDGQRETALAWLAPLEEFAAVTGVPWALARVAHCRALLAEPDAAEELFRASLDHHDRVERPFERARAELAYGEFLRRARRRGDARAQLRAALATFEDLGAAPWAERARQELRVSGETARKRDASTLLDLTSQELQVARFVAQGLPNREVAAQLFLSPRTIEYHLRNVFQKVGVSSRTELARLPLD